LSAPIYVEAVDEIGIEFGSWERRKVDSGYRVTWTAAERRRCGNLRQEKCLRDGSSVARNDSGAEK
jgi:hypothetical protein